MTGTGTAGTAPAHRHHGKRIVVGVDGSESSKDALQWAAHQAELTGDSLEAVITWEITPNTYGVALPLPSDYDPAAIAKQTLDEAISKVLGESGGPHVTTRVVEGAPARSLLEIAKGADLLVLGSRGHGPFVGMLLGSVSEYCASHATCPVVVVRHQGEEPA
ncbi:MAG TPA: universal stress protein [Acidimicrobiales bacterium]|nr:universal stress protein [Acidimicrobiales bacterium]